MVEGKARTTITLAAVELDGASDGIVARALELAAGQRGDIHVVNVVTHPPGEAAAVGDLRLRKAMEGLSELVATQLARLRERDAEAAGRLGKVRLHCAVGDPAGEISWIAAKVDADIVVLGTHERREQRRLLLGAVAERVVRVCGCAVMVVRDKHHAAPWRVPEIEPECAACGQSRRRSSGSDLWCADHAGRHLNVPLLVAHGGAAAVAPALGPA